MKSARIIAQGVAEILKGDVIAAAQVKNHLAEGELLTLLEVTDTALEEQIEDLQAKLDGRDMLIESLRDDIAGFKGEIEALEDENKYLKLSR